VTAHTRGANGWQHQRARAGLQVVIARALRSHHDLLRKIEARSNETADRPGPVEHGNVFSSIFPPNVSVRTRSTRWAQFLSLVDRDGGQVQIIGWLGRHALQTGNLRGLSDLATEMRSGLLLQTT
jgi:hypothetical protein